jgi:putative transcriptional regulator
MMQDRKFPAAPTSRIRWVAVAAIFAALAFGAPRLLRAQDIPENKAFLLVATREMPDPTFAHSVILMLPPVQVPILVVGLIVNRPTTIPVKVLFPDAAALSKDRETAYFGGPVEPTDPSMVVRAVSAPAGATAVFGDIYAIFEHDAVAQVLKTPAAVQDLRVIVGRSQWSRNQLRAEVMEGSWYVMPADAAMLFGADPMRVWRELVDRASLQETAIERPTEPIALALPPPPWNALAGRR